MHWNLIWLSSIIDLSNENKLKEKMKIIQRGVPKEEVPILITCKCCNSMIEFKLSDKEVISVRDQRDGDFYTFGCPVCTKSITYSSSLVPKPTKRSINWYEDK